MVLSGNDRISRRMVAKVANTLGGRAILPIRVRLQRGSISRAQTRMGACGCGAAYKGRIGGGIVMGEFFIVQKAV